MVARYEAEIAREAKRMMRKEVMIKAINKQITWIQAAGILGISARQMRRLKVRYERQGYDGLADHRGGRPRRKRIAVKTIQELCRLKKEIYPDFSVRHFHEYAVQKHGIAISYNWARIVLEGAGIVEKAPARGKHRRRRERRPMTGMLLHIDASTHEWIPGIPKQDLNVVMDDADGRILHARFVPEEGTASTLAALEEVLVHHGRFCELYHDRGSHFGRTSEAGQGPDEQQNGQVTRALRVLGIRQIFARSPEARGRSERAFGTLQGRLPQELRLAGIMDYDQGNRYLREHFIPKFNRLFTVKPIQAESAFTPLVGMDLRRLLSIQHERVVRKDNTVAYNTIILQIPESKHRMHFVRCPVTVHQFTNGRLGVSYQGKLLGEYLPDGTLVTAKKSKSKAA